jgi:putative two-component system response regulator
LANLAACCYGLGRIDEGIRHGERALAERADGEVEDPYAAILLRRNLARLLLAQGRLDEAEEHVAHAVVLAEAAGTPRARIAAEMTRAAHDLATGRVDFALTRIDRTLERARQVPATLKDALACAVRAEEAAGFPARAMMRLQELTDHVYGHAVQRTRKVIELAGLDPVEPASEAHYGTTRKRLITHLEPPAAPRAWAALRRLAAASVVPMDESGRHGVRVGTLVKALALAWGCPPIQALELGLAAELHDIGMSSVPSAVLGKPGRFNEGERALVQKHAEAGAAMLVDDPHPRLLLARDIARYHHARWDGRGYPDRVAGEAIPLGARMCAIADAYDAMVCGLGRPPLSMAEALAELRDCAGQQFDPELVSCFDAIVNGELEDLGLDPESGHGMDAFQELVASLREDRGFV